MTDSDLRDHMSDMKRTVGTISRMCTQFKAMLNLDRKLAMD